MAVADSILIFVLSLLVGTIGILAGARLVLDQDASFVNAAVTALRSARLRGPLRASSSAGSPPGHPVDVDRLGRRHQLALPRRLGSAVAIGFVAWIVAVGIGYLFAVVGLVTPDVLGIPGV